MTANKLRVGIISANWGAMAHLPAWRLLPDVEVTAICTSRQETAEKAAQTYGVARPFWDYAAMAADPDIDIVDAGTSPLLREKMITTALEAGKHAVNQIPFASSLEAAQALTHLQQAKGVRGLAASSVVGLPHLALMKEMIAAGEIGEIYQVRCSWQLSFFLKIMPGFPYLWFGKAGQGVSVTRNQGSQCLHALREVFGPIVEVNGTMAIQHKTWDLGAGETMRAETDDTLHALLRFESGAMGTLATSWTAGDGPGFVLEAFGAKGRLRLDALRYPSVQSARLSHGEPGYMMQPELREVPVPDRLMQVAGRLIALGDGDLMNGAQRVSLARLFEGFVGAIRGGGEAQPDFVRATEVQGLVEALYRSNESGAWCR